MAEMVSAMAAEMAAAMAEVTRMARRPRACLLFALVLPACGLGGGGVTPVRTPFNKGAYHYSAGNHDAAIAEYRAALAEDPDDHRARFNLALALAAKADSLERAGGAADTAADTAALRREEEAEYRLLLSRRPEDVRAAVNLAACEHERGARDDAFARLRSAIDRHPEAAIPRIALAAHLLRERRLEDSERLLEEALKRDPASLEANMLLGDVRAARGDRDAARRAYEKALERQPADIATLLAVGRLERSSGDGAAAATWLRRVLYIDPDHLEAHLELAGVLEAAGDLEGATAHLWRARALDHGEPPAMEPRAYRERLRALYAGLAAREELAESPAGGAR
jgi:tetratricopeptide (TPR) repeat protein